MLVLRLCHQSRLGLMTVNVGVSSSCASAAQRAVCPAEESFEDDDRASVSSKKGLRAVLCLLFQLCPSVASASQLPPQKVWDFEGWFGVAT